MPEISATESLQNLQVNDSSAKLLRNSLGTDPWVGLAGTGPVHDTTGRLPVTGRCQKVEKKKSLNRERKELLP